MAYFGKSAIVTGGASGIGLGIVTHLLEQGAKGVVIADLNAVAGAKVIDELRSAPSQNQGRVEFCACDVTSWASVCEVFQFSYLKFGERIDYVFANAGIAQMREMDSSDPTHFATATPSDLETLVDRPPSLAVIRVNLDGVLYCVHAALAYFRKQEKDKDGWRGKIVCTGSNASFYPFPNDSLYGASKHGVLGLCRALGPKVFDEGITINCFGPSVVATALAPPDFIERLEAENRLTPMSTVVAAVDIFINPGSQITGQIIENCGQRNVIRRHPEYLDDKAQANMNEFSPVDTIRRTLNVENIGIDVV